MMKRPSVYLLVLLLLSARFLFAQTLINIIPKPQQIQESKGSFIISPATVIICNDHLSVQADQLKQYLEPALGFDLAITTKPVQKNVIEIK